MVRQFDRPRPIAGSCSQIWLFAALGAIDKLCITRRHFWQTASALPNFTSWRPEFEGRSHLPALFVFGDSSDLLQSSRTQNYKGL
ncbi:MAG: hypothetical protein WBA89_19615 [Microcoleus sp.]|uniref:hypothetical protein n=1 Tax=Microcoleus sp. TaxID=44472 RepID=UPI003C72039E